MFKILFAPHEAIAEAKTEKSYGKTIGLLLLTSLLLSISVALSTGSFSMIAIGTAIAVLFISFFFTLFEAFLLKISLKILSNQGGYFEALTAMTYGQFIMSIGVLAFYLIGLLSFGNIILTAITSAIGGLVLVIMIITAYSVMLRAAAELFQTDMFTVIVAVLIVYVASILTIYFIILKMIIASLATLSGTLGGIGSSLSEKIPSLPSVSSFPK